MNNKNSIMNRRILKSNLNFTFKKCLTGQNNIDFNRVHTLDSMFSVDYSNTFEDKTLILTIDKWVMWSKKLITHGVSKEEIKKITVILFTIFPFVIFPL